MALVYNHSDSLHGPPSPSLTNPDMILPYDPRLRDSTSTNRSGHSGPNIDSLNDQMAMSLSATRAINRGAEFDSGDEKTIRRQSIPGEWNETEVADPNSSVEQTSPSTPNAGQASMRTIRHGATNSGNVFKSGTSFLNLSRFSTISTGAKSDGSNGVASGVEERDKEDQEAANEEEAASRNDFARAEEILANAKKRLTAMEGNLTRARSVSVSRSVSVASNVPEDSGISGRHNSVHGRTNGWAISAAKLRGLHRNPTGSSANHTRVFSENSIPNPQLDLVERVNERDRGSLQMRSSSAMGSIHGEDRSPGQDMFGTFRAGFGRLEPLQEDELLSPASSSSRAASRGLDNLSELSAKARSNVQLRDLREQMQDLKGKLDVLKRRTREDSMHRRSMQFLKSPSPFTDAEAWRGTPPRNVSQQSNERPEDASRSGDSPLIGRGSDASQSTPSKIAAQNQQSPIHDQTPLSSPGSMTGGPRGVIDGALSNLDEKLASSGPVSASPQRPSHRPNLSGTLPIPTNLVMRSAFDPWSPQSEKAEILNVEDEDAKEEIAAATTRAAQEQEPGPVKEPSHSSKEDTAAATKGVEEQGGQSTAQVGDSTTAKSSEEVPTSDEEPSAPDSAELSHEDRPDAFDYENFVLSSTMGTYQRAKGRSQSSSSASTIGPEYLDAELSSPIFGNSPVHHHTRNLSTGSTSSLDTFATAHSRAGSRQQGASRQQVLREAASREALHTMPGAFGYSYSTTSTPIGEDGEDENDDGYVGPMDDSPQSDRNQRHTSYVSERKGPTLERSTSSGTGGVNGERNSRDRDSASTPRARPRDHRFSSASDVSERPLSMASASSFSRPRPPSTLFHGSNATLSIASTTASVFSATMASPALDLTRDPAAVTARGQIMRLLLANPIQHAAGPTQIHPDDERLLERVVQGLQRHTAALAWACAVHGATNSDRLGLGEVRKRLEEAGHELHRGYGSADAELEMEKELEAEVGAETVDRLGDNDAADSIDGDGERFVAL